MKVNVGQIDRVTRIIFGALLITLTIIGAIGTWGWIGIVAVLTGLFRFCPLYSLLGINTCKK